MIYPFFDSRDYTENLKGVSWGWFHKKTCRHKCFWPRYSVAVWMASGSTCADTIGADEVKASTNIVVADVCAASVRKTFFPRHGISGLTLWKGCENVVNEGHSQYCE